jgi:hypothetical protein
VSRSQQANQEAKMKRNGTNRSNRKMVLNRETLAQLTPGVLADVAGGYPYTHTCPPTVSQCALSMCVQCGPPTD